MANEALEKAGLHFDDLNRIRVLDEDSSSQVSFEVPMMMILLLTIFLSHFRRKN